MIYRSKINVGTQLKPYLLFLKREERQTFRRVFCDHVVYYTVFVTFWNSTEIAIETKKPPLFKNLFLVILRLTFDAFHLSKKKKKGGKSHQKELLLLLLLRPDYKKIDGVGFRNKKKIKIKKVPISGTCLPTYLLVCCLLDLSYSNPRNGIFIRLRCKFHRVLPGRGARCELSLGVPSVPGHYLNLLSYPLARVPEPRKTPYKTTLNCGRFRVVNQPGGRTPWN